MSIAVDLQTELMRVAATGCSPAAPQVAALPFVGGALAIEMTAVDAIGCAFRKLACRVDRLAGATIDDLKRVADALASRIHYLLEPIRPIEVDRDRCVVQLRSSPPQRGDDGSTYYELLAGRGELTLVRWRQPRGAPREAISAEVTRAVLARLAADFSAV